MNQEIKSAVARSSSLPPCSPAGESDFEELLYGPQTVATLSAALCVCPHPDRCLVEAQATRGGQSEPIAWCAACGAMGLVGAPENGFAFTHWERPALVQQFTPDHFEEIATVATFVASCAMAAGKAGDLTEADPATSSEFREIEHALRTVAALALFSELRRARSARAELAFRLTFRLPETVDAK